MTQAGNVRRTGDAIAIEGDYQHRARHQGFVVQRFWHAEKERMIRSYAPPAAGERVLDVGCGSGVISDVLASFGARVTGVDGNPRAIAFARRTYHRPNLDFVQGLVDELADPPGSVDRIYCLEVIEHLYADQVHALLAQFHRLLRPGGTLCLTTPNFRGVWPAIEWTLDTLRLVPTLAEEQHVSRFSRASLRAALESAGWSVTQLRTFSTVAPFASVLGWNVGRSLARLEDRAGLPFGAVLFAVATRP